ncbi:hypothetical protein PG997_014459 [Apiospora hydei]|uniref:Uncharacterized protein n=1 Tax=Apiospora hydei TaxID=1337664 RepID=A0ABR1UUI1_9PEZI
MRFSSNAVSASLCAWLGVALAEKTIGTWTLSDVHRTRSPDNTTCNWNFTITASEIRGARPPAQCAFTVRGTKALGCDKRDLGDVTCTDGATQYDVGGGWSSQGFVVISVVNPTENAQAYFGYSDAQLNGGGDLPAQDKDAILIGSDQTSTAASSSPSSKIVEREALPIEKAQAWTVVNLKRVVDQDRRQVIVNFTLEAENAQGVFCVLQIAGPQNTNLATWPWYDRRCKGSSGWTVSMGYVPDGDAGIITVVSPSRHREAFFGVRGINEAETLGSIGPNAVADF